MRVVFRVDSSPLIGMGHLMRSLVLAELLRARGASCHFVCRAHTGHQADFARSRGFDVTLLPMSDRATVFSPTNYLSWLGASVEVDVRETADILRRPDGFIADWLVVDHYGADVHWQRALHPYSRHLMVIDDLLMRSHDCDLLLNQSLADSGAGHALHSCARADRLLLGPKYALLRPEFEQAAARRQVRYGPVRRILVAFGGADPYDFSMLATKACFEVWPHIELDVVLGAASQHLVAMQEFAQQDSRVHLHSAVSTVCTLMESADFSIGAAGMMTWERCTTGLPAAVVVMTENQQPIADFVVQMGAGVHLGNAENLGDGDMVEVLLQVRRHESRLPAMSLAALNIADGLGASRVVSAMAEFQ